MFERAPVLKTWISSTSFTIEQLHRGSGLPPWICETCLAYGATPDAEYASPVRKQMTTLSSQLSMRCFNFTQVFNVQQELSCLNLDGKSFIFETTITDISPYCCCLCEAFGPDKLRSSFFQECFLLGLDLAAPCSGCQRGAQRAQLYLQNA